MPPEVTHTTAPPPAARDRWRQEQPRQKSDFRFSLSATQPGAGQRWEQGGKRSGGSGITCRRSGGRGNRRGWRRDGRGHGAAAPRGRRPPPPPRSGAPRRLDPWPSLRRSLLIFGLFFSAHREFFVWKFKEEKEWESDGTALVSSWTKDFGIHFCVGRRATEILELVDGGRFV